jgi:hypothetical protein
LTPQQDGEARVKANEGTGRSLERQFDELKVGISSPVWTSGASSGESTATLAGAHSSADSFEMTLGASQEPTSRRQGEHDHEEPILQNNDERFCLLPVK